MKKLCVALLLLTTACVPGTATTNSPIEGKNGLAKGSMNISFKANGNNTDMTAIASTGEVFTGTVVAGRTESSAGAGSIGEEYTTDRYGNPKKKTSFRTGSGGGTKYSSRASAVLIGNKGRSIRCTFTLSYPSLGITAGAVGNCAISDGGVVPVSVSNKK